MSTCGTTYIRAVYEGRSLNLASCAATVGITPLPEVHVRSGQAVHIVKAEGGVLVLTSTSPAIATVTGTDVRALRAGRATIVMQKGAFCSLPAPPTEGPQPTRCPLLTVVVESG